MHPSAELLANKLVSGIETSLFTAALCSWRCAIGTPLGLHPLGNNLEPFFNQK